MSDIEKKLDRFIASFDTGQLARSASHSGADDDADYAALLAIYMSEAAVGLRLIAPFLQGRRRLLEIGSGIGLLTSFLKSEGYDITGLEPGVNGGFSFMPAMHAAIAGQLAPEHRPTILPIGAEQLDPEQHGRFDLVFSTNVLEHILPLDTAMGAMSGVLAEDGIMRHLCPNYHFPYEPHLGIPLLPLAPALTRCVLRRSINANLGIWQTLNFVTASRMRRLARGNGLRISFETGVMGRFFNRLREDQEFAERHRGLVTRAAATPLLGRLLATALRIFPPTLATPMIMTLTHAGPRTTG